LDHVVCNLKKHMILFFNVAPQQSQKRKAVMNKTIDGRRVTGIGRRQAIGHRSNVESALPMLLQHHGDRATVAGHAALLKAWEKPILLLPVMAMVRETAKKLEKGLELGTRNPTRFTGAMQSRFKRAQHLQNQLMFRSKRTRCVHIGILVC
jgi:hypothetical protein